MKRQTIPDQLKPYAINDKAESLYANIHSQRAFAKGVQYALDVLGVKTMATDYAICE